MNNFLSPAEVHRLTYIEERIRCYRLGLKDPSISGDFPAHAVEDLDWLSDLVCALGTKAALADLEYPTSQLDRAASATYELQGNLQEALEVLESCRTHIDLIKASPDLQVLGLQREIGQLKAKLEKHSQQHKEEIQQLKARYARLDARLKALPLSWQERLLSDEDLI